MRLWVADEGRELAALPTPDRVGAVAFSPDGKSLAAGSKDGSVPIWPVPATN
ncbi:MAG TPA: hypothetical protein VD866_29075 [Urbifossiella sp.]|nr:hypothetical protein [Urbifossiella sp.]